jgi:uncharacterized DUF497 family protein
VEFDWSKEKEAQNVAKHGVDFLEAREPFSDLFRVILQDVPHSDPEVRMLCIGQTDRGRILTVRYTRRGDRIRIIGAGYWRKGRKIYEKRNF